MELLVVGKSSIYATQLTLNLHHQLFRKLNSSATRSIPDDATPRSIPVFQFQATHMTDSTHRRGGATPNHTGRVKSSIATDDPKIFPE